MVLKYTESKLSLMKNECSVTVSHIFLKSCQEVYLCYGGVKLLHVNTVGAMFYFFLPLTGKMGTALNVRDDSGGNSRITSCVSSVIACEVSHCFARTIFVVSFK